MKPGIEIVPFDGIWGSYRNLLDLGRLEFPAGSLSALDLGSGPGYTLFILYHDFGFESLIGVDLLSESGILAQVKRQLPLEDRTPAQQVLWHCSSLYELYRLLIQPRKGLVHRTSLQPLEFYQHFNFVWETGIDHYLNSLDEKKEFDVIILSNVLHFMPHQDAKTIIESAATHLTDDGTLGVRVYHTASEKFHGKDWERIDATGKRVSSDRSAFQFRQQGKSYYAYDKDGFLNLFEGMEVVSFEGVQNTSAPGYRFLTAIVKNSPKVS